MKKLLSLILTLVLMCSLIPAAHAASDESTQAAQTLYELGLFRGTGTNLDGTPIFDLDKTPTRNQAVIMLVRLLGKEEEALAGNWELPFTDVAKGSTAYPYIGYAYANGLTNGTTATTYSGTNSIRANQYITFVLRAMGYVSGVDFQVSTAWEFSDKIGLTDGTYSAATSSFTRGDVVEISRSALQLACKGTDVRLVQRLVADGAVDADTAAAQGLDAYGWLNNMYLHYDIRTFTLYAFMNYTGYDDNNGYAITGVRQQVRQALDGMDLDLSEPDYFTERNLEDQYYEQALRSMGAAPEFKYLSSADVPAKLKDLPEKLAEFYAAANIPALYEACRPVYEAAMARYRTAGREIVRMMAYFDMDQRDIPAEFAIEPNLLDAVGRSIGFGNEDKFYDYGVLRLGPSASGDKAARHSSVAFCWFYVTLHPTVYRLDREVRALVKELDLETKKSADEIVMSSLADALTAYFADIPDENFAADELTEYFYDRIPEFEDFDDDIDSFIKMLITDYVKDAGNHSGSSGSSNDSYGPYDPSDPDYSEERNG